MACWPCLRRWFYLRHSSKVKWAACPMHRACYLLRAHHTHGSNAMRENMIELCLSMKSISHRPTFVKIINTRSHMVFCISTYSMKRYLISRAALRASGWVYRGTEIYVCVSIIASAVLCRYLLRCEIDQCVDRVVLMKRGYFLKRGYINFYLYFNGNTQYKKSIFFLLLTLSF